MFDKRGVGMSDPISDWDTPLHQQWAQDAHNVIDASALERPAVVSWEPLGVGRALALMDPAAIDRLVLVNPAQDPSAIREHFQPADDELLETRTVEEIAFPSRIGDPHFRQWLERAGRLGASPTLAARMWQRTTEPRDLTPPGIAVPTLVIHTGGMNPRHRVEAVAAAIDTATIIDVLGDDAYPIAGDVDALVDAMTGFLGGGAVTIERERRLAAVLFVDVVGSTATTSREGDARWRAIIDEHDVAVRAEVARRGGRVVKYTGDGALAILTSVTDAVAAARALHARIADTGLQIRAGIHVGDVDERGSDVSGVAVNLAARVMDAAADGDTVLSSTAAEAALGSAVHLEALTPRSLKGIDGVWTLFRVTGHN